MTIFANVRLLEHTPPTPAVAPTPDRLVDVVVEAGVVSAIVPAGTAPHAGERVEADGRLLLPGLWDRHVHMNQWAMARRRFDVSSASSAAHAARLALEAIDRFEPESGRPLVGFGFRDGLWPDAPHRSVLDAAVGVIPTILVAADLHSSWLNSAALAAFGFPQGHDGVARENECFDLLRRLSDVPEAVLDDWVADALADAVSRGVVGVVDMEMGWSPGEWMRRAELGGVPLRVDAAVYEQDLDRAIAAGLASGDAVAPQAEGAGLLRLGPLKVIADGSLNTRTAFCFEPYHGVGVEHRGVLNMDARGLEAVMSQARAAGIHCAIHAIGDNANALVLDAFAASGASGSIEHAQLLRADDARRMARLGIDASVQPQHAVDDRLVTDAFWADRAVDAFRLRSLRSAGVRVRLGSDAPVASLDPWVAIAAAVFRAQPGDEPWRPEEALSVTEAIEASTASGTAVPRLGDPADLVLVDADPRSVDVSALRALPVAATVVAGAQVFSTLG